MNRRLTQYFVLRCKEKTLDRGRALRYNHEVPIAVIERERCFMAKDLSISMLYDFYGDLLTEKQQEVIELYYNEDLSLSEIASHSGITRQGVRDSIKRAEFQLSEFEEQLGLANRFEEIKGSLDDILKNAFEIEQINSRLYNSKDISTRVSRITKLARHVAEL